MRIYVEKSHLHIAVTEKNFHFFHILFQNSHCIIVNCLINEQYMYLYLSIAHNLFYLKYKIEKLLSFILLSPCQNHGNMGKFNSPISHIDCDFPQSSHTLNGKTLIEMSSALNSLPKEIRRFFDFIKIYISLCLIGQQP